MKNRNRDRLLATVVLGSLILVACVMGTPAASAQAPQKGGISLSQSSPLPPGISPYTPVISASCVGAQPCKLVTTNGNSTQVKTIYNTGTSTFHLQCQDQNNNNVDQPSQDLTTGFGVQGMSCGNDASFLVLSCDASPCYFVYVP
jgi:hypothetical protein